MKTKIYKLSALLIVFILLVAAISVGTVYARYTSSGSNTASTEISTFGCSYTIDEVSSYTFNNTAASGNSSRSIKFTARNYDTDDTQYSDVDVQAIFRFTAPYVFLSDLAVQIVDSGMTAVTPQYNIADIISTASTGNTLDTASSTKYGEYSGATDQTLSLSMTTDSSGKITRVVAVYSDATYGNYTITLSSASSYYSDNSVTFAYTRSGGSAVYVDCKLEPSSTASEQTDYYFDYYYLDISIPALKLAGGSADTETLFFYFTPIAEHDYDTMYDVTSGSENTLYYDYEDPTDTYTKRSGVLSLNADGTDVEYSVTINGYRYDVSGVKVYSDEAHSTQYTGDETATVRVKKTPADGGGYDYEYYYYDSTNNAYIAFSSTSTANVYLATVSGTNYYIYTDSSEGNLTDQTADYSGAAYTPQEDKNVSGYTYSFFQLYSINYYTKAQVHFVQASATPTVSY